METVALVGGGVGAVVLVILWQVFGTRRALYFNGVYQSERTGHDWSYLRFYRDGTVIHAVSTNEPSHLRRWFTKKHDAVGKGKVTLKGNHISFSCVVRNVAVDYDGEIDRDRLYLHWYSHSDKRGGKTMYVFVKW
jgi:hypothetical protein